WGGGWVGGVGGGRVVGGWRGWVGVCVFCFFFKDTATTEIYTLSLHDALPIFGQRIQIAKSDALGLLAVGAHGEETKRSEEHTSELQSHLNLVCRLLLEKK